ncbi:acyl-CoA reductase [Roseospira navarrensis]|uniref:acyl-CoA reductase n=1 Tax=Roseospira navarrensis TaxID=140058 RepID=UPI001295526D|nr:acyl-CoA reductase [Roseospira navarrensis]
MPPDIALAQQVVLGDPARLTNRPAPVWDPARMALLADLSRTLLAMPAARALPDVVTFAYWARAAHLKALSREAAHPDPPRVGLGLVFHICPSNVPVNVAFSMAFGLLAGNTGVLRLPSADSPTITALVDGLAAVLARPEHAALAEALLLVRYARNDAVNAVWSARADGRVVWGGDATVQHMRGFPMPPRAREVSFPDRYSLCSLKAEAVLALDDAGLEALCGQLYADVYIMEQAACSSPQLIAWVGDAETVTQAQARLWPAFAAHVKGRHPLAPIRAMDKFVAACDSALAEDVRAVHRHGNTLYRVDLAGLRPEQESCRGYAGTLHEVVLDSLDALAPIVTDRYQTLTTFGHPRDDLARFVTAHGLRGIDRVVPVGQALDMGVIWDGYDIIGSLSRVIDIR